MGRSHGVTGPCQDLADDVPFHIGQAALDPVVLEGGPFVIEAKEVQVGGVEVVVRVDVFDGAPAGFVGEASARLIFPRRAGHPAAASRYLLGGSRHRDTQNRFSTATI